MEELQTAVNLVVGCFLGLVLVFGLLAMLSK